MPSLKRSELKDAWWQQQGIQVPAYDAEALVGLTAETPCWLHIGPGNIFRGYLAEIQDELLSQGLVSTGIISLSTSDPEKLTVLRDQWDMLTLQVVQGSRGIPQHRVIASVTEGLAAAVASDWRRALEVAEAPSLQIISFTITEKGYRLTDLDGAYTDVVEDDLGQGPEHPRHAMSIATALLLRRYQAGGDPVALVSFDNFTHNGHKVRESILTIAARWITNGFAESAFLEWLRDDTKVAYPLSVIDRIVPRSSKETAAALIARGLNDVGPIMTSRGSDVAGFVNTEAAHYLLIEDHFPNGRPPLQEAGVIMTDASSVDRFEGMKVTTCLNPLHTALAVSGCLLGHATIAACMEDPDLAHWVRLIGYHEGLPVVQDPGVIEPRAFLTEVIEERLTNPNTGDTPARIATDTSQKVGIRFGETLKTYGERPDLDILELRGIPMAIALWLRYLLAVDDEGKPFTPSPDPQLDVLQEALSKVSLGTQDLAVLTDALLPILRQTELFRLDLVEAGLSDRIIEDFAHLNQGPGAVRRTLTELRHSNPVA